MADYTRVVDKVLSALNKRRNAEAFYNDPAGWSESMLGVQLWSKQRHIAQSLVDNKSVAVKAAHGVGKSYLVAILICWWIDTRYPEAFVASTAPSQKQIGAIVWRYVRQIKTHVSKRYAEGLVDHELPGYITADNQWKDSDGIILGFGRKPPDNKEEDSFQGIHSNVLAVGDEAVGLSEDMIDALGNITTNAGSRRIVICNPTNPGSYIGKIFKTKPANWTLHTISVFDSPNFTGGEGLSAEALSQLVDQSYVEEKKAEYGENSPRYISRVLGEFAYDLGDTLIKPEDVATSYDTEIIPTSDTPAILGCDVARFGKDFSVIYRNDGGVIAFVDVLKGESRTTATASWINKHAVDCNATEVRIDAIGVGGGVVDALLALEPRYKVVEVVSNAASPDRKQWHNWRAFTWDLFRRGLRDGTFSLDQEDQYAERLHDELVSVVYKFSPQTGGLLIESKDEMSKRGMKSPDFADAAVIASMTFSDDPLEGFESGDKVYSAPLDILGDVPNYLSVLGGF